MTKARLFEPMLLLATNSLPEGNEWAYELKLDGYRAIALKSNGKVHAFTDVWLASITRNEIQHPRTIRLRRTIR